jgi:hypothetical protein
VKLASSLGSALGLALALSGCSEGSPSFSSCRAIVVTLDGGLPDAANDSEPLSPGWLPADECAAVCEGVIECALGDSGATAPVQVQCFPQCN